MRYSTVMRFFELRARRIQMLRSKRRWTLTKIGVHYGISPQRVAQILKRLEKDHDAR
jgi:DNA-directed RNA polymerase specialized sigma subunit